MTLSANNGSGSSKSGSSKSIRQRIRLPRPDLRNITMLTDKLPNGPILPWNHYDLPAVPQPVESVESTDKTEED